MAINDCENCTIRSTSLFNEISPTGGSRFAAETWRVEHPSGDYVFHEGEPATAAFTLYRGNIKLVRGERSGRTQIVRLLLAGDLLGMEGLFDEPYRYSAIALTPITLCHLPFTLLRHLQNHEPRFTQALLRRWRHALDEVEMLAIELGTRKANERIAAFLLHWKGKHSVTTKWLPLPLSRAELGQLLGLRIETVSRILAEWKRQGLFVERNGAICFQDPDRLTQIAYPERRNQALR